MPTGKARRKESLRENLEAIVIRIPVTVDTMAAAVILVQQLIALARVVKVPLQIEKVAPFPIVVEGEKVTPVMEPERVVSE